MSLIEILAFIFILGAAVILHEFGHFIVAKLLGIRVETFSVGFGKRLWGRRWGTTDYRLSLIPLGGYVKLGGDESNSGLEEGGAEEIPTRERFDLRPRWQKLAVGFAGPAMNILTALAIPFLSAMIVGMPSTPSPVVSSIDANGAAAAAGLQRGDRIVAFNGRENPTWRFIENDALLTPEQPLPVTVERGGQRVNATITPRRAERNGEAYGDLGFQPDPGVLPVVVNSAEAGSPGAEAGLQPGDRLVAINDEPVQNTEQTKQYILTHPDALRLTVERGGERVTLPVRGNRPENRLGVYFRPPPTEKVGPGSAIAYAFDLNIETLRLTGKALGQVFTGQRSARDTFSGPIGIARASGQAVRELGWEGVFWMLAFLSLNLGIFNLLPIPVLDGGMIFMILLEGALGWVGVQLSTTVRERIQQVGFVFLLLLMSFVIINDITKTFSGGKAKDAPAEAQQQK